MSTHLAVPPKWMANLETAQLPNDNTDSPFYFDREFNSPFSIVAGYSFIITDIIVNPDVINFAPGQFFLLVITIDGGRCITIRSAGNSVHIPLTAGLVVPGPGVRSPGTKGLNARNTTFSSGAAGIQVMGYFISTETVLATGQVFTA